jgi:aryl-phospho-beta-D-glucosidase BglC (GH1 family)
MKRLLGKVQSSLRDSSSPSTDSDQAGTPTGPQQGSKSGAQPMPSSSPLPSPWKGGDVSGNGSSTIPPPTSLDVIRYRYHHGVNLGSIFALEQWLFPSMFEHGAESEVQAVSASLRARGKDATIAKWRSHWQRGGGSGNDEEWKWLAREAKCTSIRLPVGYWVLGKEFCKKTPFEGVGDVYEEAGAWDAVRQVVRRARGEGIGVLIDFHGLPGGANKDAHSGTGTGKAEFWGSKKYRDLATKCLCFMAREIRHHQDLDGVIGLQIVNEAVWDAKHMYEWYEEVLEKISQIDETLPVYVSDGWDLERALKWTNGRRGRNPVVVDTHKYYTFSDQDRRQAPGEIIRRIPGELHELDGKEGSLHDHGEAQVIIGEYSCVLDGQTWSRVRNEEKEGYVREFGRAQSKKWQERSGGAYFWTWKMEWMDGGEWGFVEQCNKGNIVPPRHLRLSRESVLRQAEHARQVRDELAVGAYGSHVAYWTRTSPGRAFEHERYAHGWQLGFSDALAFFVMKADGGFGDRARAAEGGGDQIACLDIWVKKRMGEYQDAQASSGQGSAFGWEWEQGLRAGVLAFNGLVG